MRKPVWQLSAVLGAIALAACGGGTGVSQCSATAPCATGQTCANGICTLGSADAGSDAGSGGIGAACTSSASCASGETCLPSSDGFPSGYCTRACAASACPIGSKCDDLSSTPAAEKACGESCSSSSDCRSGYSCCAGFGNTCVPAAFCATDGGTGGGSAGGSGGGSAGGSAAGAGGGSAGGSAGGGSGGGSAGGSGATDGGIDPPPGDGGTLACATVSLVSGGMIGPANAPAACAVPLEAPALLPGETVQNLGRTKVGTTVQFFVDAGVGTISVVEQVWDAGPSYASSITLSNDTGDDEQFPNFIAPLAVTAPDGTSYLTFDDNITSSTDPTTEELAQDDFQVATEALTLPNTTQALTYQGAGYPTGEWSFQVGDIAYLCATNDAAFQGIYQGFNATSCDGGVGALSTYYDVRVVTKPVSGSIGTVNLALYMVSTNWTAAMAMTDPAWARFLTGLETLYGHSGLCVGTVTFYDVPAWAKATYATGITDQDMAPCGNLYQLFTLAQSISTVNLFFVDSIDASSTIGVDEDTGAEGDSRLSGSVPGPLGFGGTEYSGVALDLSDISSACTSAVDYSGCGADALAYAAAHKTGHLMGLYHTTEAAGDSFDYTSDTAECPTSCDADGSGTVDFSECGDDSETDGSSCGGADNLMFWTVDPASSGNVSPQQGQLSRTSIVVSSPTTSSRSHK